MRKYFTMCVMKFMHYKDKIRVTHLAFGHNFNKSID